jgi:DNA repair exonuclease SbcCD ATPase subunit
VKISFIKAAGFRGIKRAIDVKFPEGFLVISGRNGSGKSTICDALEYALTGTLEKYSDDSEKGERVSDYLWWRGEEAPQERYVSVGLISNEGEELVITRSPKGLQELTEQELREKLCGEHNRTEDLKDLSRTSIIRDENITRFSLDLPERGRVSFVKSVVGIDEFARIEETVYKAASVLEKEMKRAEQEYNKTRDRITEYLTSLSEMRSDLSEDVDVTSAEKELRSLLSTPSSDIAELRKAARQLITRRRIEMDSLTAVLESLVMLDRRRAEIRTTEFETRRKAATDKAKELGAKLNKLSKQKTETEKRLKAAQEDQPKLSSLAQVREHGSRLGLQGGKCPLCGSMVSLDHFNKHLKEIHDYLESQTNKVAALVREVADLGEQQQAVTDQIAQIERSREELSRAEQSLKMEYDGLVNRTRDYGLNLGPEDTLTVDVLRSAIEDRRKSISVAEQNVAILETARIYDRITDVEKQLKVAKDESELIEKTLEGRRSTYNHAQRIRRALERLSGEIVDERLAGLNPILRELYFRLRPHIDWEEISYQIRGDVRHFLSLRVGGELNLNPKFMFSSGQRRAVGLAFLLALHLSRPWCRLNALVLDDPIQHIDDYRALHLVEVLSAIRRTGRQIVCAVEDPALAELLCRRLRSQQYGDGRRVDMEYKADEGVSVRGELDIPPFPRAVLLSA